MGADLTVQALAVIQGEPLEVRWQRTQGLEILCDLTGCQPLVVAIVSQIAAQRTCWDGTDVCLHHTSDSVTYITQGGIDVKGDSDSGANQQIFVA